MEKKFVVVAKGYEFVEAIILIANSKEDAIMSAAKRMRADNLILAEQVEKLYKFKTNTHIQSSSYDGWHYIAQRDSTVEVGFAKLPSYSGKNNPNDWPHPQLEVCEVINRIINPFSEDATIRHIILGKKLPNIIISSNCYCDDTFTTEAYF